MCRSIVCAAALCVLAVGFTVADEKKSDKAAPTGITIELKAFKLTPGFEGASADLIGYMEEQERLYFYINGSAEATAKVPTDGDYNVVVRAAGDPAMNERAKFKLSIDGKLVGQETTLTTDDPKDYSFTATLKAGERKVKIEYTNDVYKESEYDRNFYLHGVKLTPAAKKDETKDKAKDKK